MLNNERLNDLAKFPDTYGHVWEGEFLVITDAQVFKDRYETAAFDPEEDWDGPYYGLDFGYAADETAGCKLWISENRLYIEHELYEKKLDINDIVPVMARKLPLSTMHTIRCDSARPETIAYMKRHGAPASVGVKKGKNSVVDGVEFMKSFDKIIIHPRCINTQREFAKYSYKVDRLSGDILPVIVDADNHLIDSIRYALEPLTRFKAAPRIRML